MQKRKTLKQNLNKISKPTKALVIALIAVVVLFLVDIGTPFGGNVRFYSEWVRCGQRPLQASVNLGGNIPHYESAPVIGLIRGFNRTYYCTPYEAELNGISASADQYYFPHITNN